MSFFLWSLQTSNLFDLWYSLRCSFIGDEFLIRMNTSILNKLIFIGKYSRMSKVVLWFLFFGSSCVHLNVPLTFSQNNPLTLVIILRELGDAFGASFQEGGLGRTASRILWYSRKSNTCLRILERSYFKCKLGGDVDSYRAKGSYKGPNLRKVWKSTI